MLFFLVNKKAVTLTFNQSNVNQVNSISITDTEFYTVPGVIYGKFTVNYNGFGWNGAHISPLDFNIHTFTITFTTGTFYELLMLYRNTVLNVIPSIRFNAAASETETISNADMLRARLFISNNDLRYQLNSAGFSGSRSIDYSFIARYKG